MVPVNGLGGFSKGSWNYTKFVLEMHYDVETPSMVKLFKYTGARTHAHTHTHTHTHTP